MQLLHLHIYEKNVLLIYPRYGRRVYSNSVQHGHFLCSLAPRPHLASLGIIHIWLEIRVIVLSAFTADIYELL